jgi:hypothetical protein
MNDTYIMKIRGVNNMPDFIQIRDERFTLIAYFRADRPDTTSIPYGEKIPAEKLQEFIRELPYGKIMKIPGGMFSESADQKN